jgi:hypothetical protein
MKSYEVTTILAITVITWESPDSGRFRSLSFEGDESTQPADEMISCVRSAFNSARSA